MPKQARINGIKAFRCYTMEQAAEVRSVSLRTIRNWASDGLRVMDGTRPALIRGDDLRNYIKRKRENRAAKIRIDTFYCLPCRKERRAAEGLADCETRGGGAKLTAFCKVCGTVMSKPVSKAQVPDLTRTLDLNITRH